MSGRRGVLVIVRHGQSVANLTSTYAGWYDSDLTSKGIDDAHRCALFLKNAGLRFDLCFASYLRRSIRTLWTILDVMDQMYVPTFTTWRLNECHCGQFTGLTPTEISAKFGRSTFTRWRQIYNCPPPMLAPDDMRSPLCDPHYSGVSPRELPLGESLQMAWNRLEGYWNREVMTAVHAGKTVLVVCHGNIIRGIRRAVEGMSEAEMMGKTVIANGFPIVYQFEGRALISKSTLGEKTARKACKAGSQVI
jgi:2,3-bisphosphoglycerate-dependent phosphoglycerate mutase